MNFCDGQINNSKFYPIFRAFLTQERQTMGTGGIDSTRSLYRMKICIPDAGIVGIVRLSTCTKTSLWNPQLDGVSVLSLMSSFNMSSFVDVRGTASRPHHTFRTASRRRSRTALFRVRHTANKFALRCASRQASPPWPRAEESHHRAGAPDRCAVVGDEERTRRAVAAAGVGWGA